MNNNHYGKRPKKSIKYKLKRFWSIPIVRILFGLICIVVAILFFISLFNGCGEDFESSQDVSQTISENSNEISVPSEEISEFSEAPSVPIVSIPKPWNFSDGIDTISNDINSKYAIVINSTTRQVLAGKNYTDRIYPASMTKIMTLIVAAESNLNLNDLYTMDYRLINKYYLAGATTTGIQAGDTVTVKDLVYGAILLSAADATAAIAEIVSGSEDAYVDLMNETAKKIGCNSSHFTNTSGLYDTQNYSTLADIALMLDYAMSLPLSREVLSTDIYTTAPTPKSDAGYTFHSTMFSRIHKDSINKMTVLGGKTGYLSETRHCLASMAEGENGEKYIVVTVEGQRPYDPINDCMKLYSKYYGS